MKLIVGIILVVASGYAHAGDGGAKTKLAHQEHLKKEQAQVHPLKLFAFGEVIDESNTSIFDQATPSVLEVGHFVAVPAHPTSKTAVLVRGQITFKLHSQSPELYAVRVGDYNNYVYSKTVLRKLIQPVF